MDKEDEPSNRRGHQPGLLPMIPTQEGHVNQMSPLSPPRYRQEEPLMHNFTPTAPGDMPMVAHGEMHHPQVHHGGFNPPPPQHEHHHHQHQQRLDEPPTPSAFAEGLPEAVLRSVAVAGMGPVEHELEPQRTVFKRKRYKPELKGEVLNFLKQESNKDLKYETIANKFGVSTSALRDWRRMWAKTGELEEDVKVQDENPAEKKKFKRKRYNTQLKVEVLQFLRAHKACLNFEEVARRFDVSVSALRDWRKNEEEILKSVQEKRGNMKANPKYQLKRLSDAVMHAFEQNSKLPPESQIPISMSAIQKKTKEIQKAFLEQHAQQPFMEGAELEAVKAFKASNTWAARIMKRIKSEAPKTLDQLHQLVAQYQPDQVYCMDQTTLFVKVLPNRNVRNGGYEKVLPNAEHMQPDDRVNIFICTNESGSQKLPPVIVGRQKQPWKFPDPAGQQMLPYICKEDESRSTLQRWWQIFLSHIREQSSTPALLVVPEGSDLSELLDEKGQVRVEVLPGDVANQPIAQGISFALKTSYRYKLLHGIFSTFADRAIRRTIAQAANLPHGMKGLSEGSPPHFADVMRLLSTSWDGITVEMISGCWCRARLRPNEKTPAVNVEEKLSSRSPETNVLLKEILGFFREANVSGNRVPDAVSDAAYEAAVIEVLELATDDQGHIRPEADLAVDFDYWCDLEATQATRDLLNSNTNMAMNIEPRAVPQDEDRLDPPQGLQKVDVQQCATEILSIAARLMRSQPEYHSVASELMEFPDKILKAGRKAASRTRLYSSNNVDKQPQNVVYKI